MIKKTQDNHSTTLATDALVDAQGGHRRRSRWSWWRPWGATRTNFTVQQKLRGNSPFYSNGRNLYYRNRRGYQRLTSFYNVDPWV